MKMIDAREAEAAFSEVLDQVEQGEDVLITREGKVVARIVSTRFGNDVERALKAVEELDAGRRTVSLGGLSVKDLIAEGRE